MNALAQEQRMPDELDSGGGGSGSVAGFAGQK